MESGRAELVLATNPSRIRMQLGIGGAARTRRSKRSASPTSKIVDGLAEPDDEQAVPGFRT